MVQDLPCLRRQVFIVMLEFISLARRFPARVKARLL